MTRRLRNGPEFPILQSRAQLPIVLGPELVKLSLKDPGKTTLAKGPVRWVESSEVSLMSGQRISSRKRTLQSVLLLELDLFQPPTGLCPLVTAFQAAPFDLKSTPWCRVCGCIIVCYSYWNWGKIVTCWRSHVERFSPRSDWPWTPVLNQPLGCQVHGHRKTFISVIFQLC